MQKDAKESSTTAVTPQYLWLSGKTLPWDSATVHISQIVWTAISAVFEGIRAYWNQEQGQLYLLFLEAHLQRLFTSMKLMRMAPQYVLEDLATAIVELLRANRLRTDAYVQPLAYFGSGVPGYRAAADMAPDILLTTRPIESFLKLGRRFHCCTSTWQRISDTVMPPRAKCIANYQNSRLVSTEAAINGYDAGIILNQEGRVAEGAYACVFLVRDGTVITPDVTSGILESITRTAIIQLCREELGLAVVERSVERTELYVADEAFLCGTWAEITPIVSLDRYRVGNGEVGPVTATLEQLYHDLVRGIDPRHPEWRAPVW